MLKIRAVLLAVTFVSLSNMKAQEGFSDWEKSYFTKNASSKQQEFVKKVTFPDKIEVPKVKPARFGMNEKQGWDACLKRSFAAFFTEAKSYRYSKTVTLVYGLFNLGNYDAFKYQPALKNHFNDTAWVEETFSTLLPLFKESWYLLDNDTRIIYVSIIKHTERYLRTFDYQQELKYHRQLVLIHKQDDFIIKSSNSASKNEFRKAEAFIFRRIKDAKENKGNWTVNWLQKMLKNLKLRLLIN